MISDFLISFYSEGFPLSKAITYANLRKPFLVNDPSLQAILWERRLCLMILDKLNALTPRRLVVTRDSGPRLASPELARHIRSICGLELSGKKDGTGGGIKNSMNVQLIENEDTLLVDGDSIRKPFTEKPVNGKDNNMIIYYRSDKGGGGDRLYREFGNRCAEYDPNLSIPRCVTSEDQSYIYEEYFVADDVEDIKVYTVGPGNSHGQTRKWGRVWSPTKNVVRSVDWRKSTELSSLEKDIAARISRGFGQGFCTFDLIRVGSLSYVMGVTPFKMDSFPDKFERQCIETLKSMFEAELIRRKAYD